ncbi:MAG: hypothetical protein A2542_02730 [Parcubacteria group bacterium RIFOXYD2_FULL_52_8]|nr:MAG: hypothetical protein A2542_02730 [Parcubacteria group bacterium RIFOXYD2_FULL_52_8]
MKSKKRILVLDFPVLHRGFVDILRAQRDRISSIAVISPELYEQLSAFKPSITTLDFETAKQVLHGLGFPKVTLFSADKIGSMGDRAIFLVNDEVSRGIAKKIIHADVEWLNVFLRWDTASVATLKETGAAVTSDPRDIAFMKKAALELEKSSDWWRQIGAVAVKKGKIVLRAYNAGMPNDHTPYQAGGPRDVLPPGVKPELVTTIHAEQKIIAVAARKGIALKGASLYVTCYPCPVCAKLIAQTGIAKCFFATGWFSLDGKEVMESAGVKIYQVREK